MKLIPYVFLIIWTLCAVACGEDKPLGSKCDSPGDCESDRCIETPAGNVCSDSCSFSDNKCGSGGLVCRFGDGYCAPEYGNKFGEKCEDNDDCSSALCGQVNQTVIGGKNSGLQITKACTLPCDPNQSNMCPQGFECVKNTYGYGLPGFCSKK